MKVPCPQCAEPIDPIGFHICFTNRDLYRLGSNPCYPWINNEGTKGECDRCMTQVRFNTNYRYENFVVDHKDCK